MAAEFENVTAEFLARLPEQHPDRPFLAGLQSVVTAYVAREPGAADPLPAAVEPLPSDGSVPVESDRGGAPTPVETLATVEQREQERVTLRGRMGKPPRFSTTPRGVRRAEFNLAVHEDDASTTWHTVLAFRERAERLEAANPQRGQATAVIGYHHRTQRTDRAGNPTTVTRIVAAHIRLR